MRTSYDVVLDELASHGLGPRAGSAARRVVGVRAADGSRQNFAKSFAAPAVARDGFTALLDHLSEQLDRRDMAAMIARVHGNTAAGRQFAKALRDLNHLYVRSAVRPIVIRKDALARRPKFADLLAKAFATLERNDLTQHQRIRLTGALAELNDRVFAKSDHPALDRIDAVQAQLNAALASGAGNLEPLCREALKLISSGKLTPADHARLSLLLSEIRNQIEEHSNA